MEKSGPSSIICSPSCPPHPEKGTIVEPDPSADPDYVSYLLRLWRDHQGAVWRASLEETSSGESRTFAEVHMLLGFLARLTGEPWPEPSTTRPRHPGAET